MMLEFMRLQIFMFFYYWRRAGSRRLYTECSLKFAHVCFADFHNNDKIQVLIKRRFLFLYVFYVFFALHLYLFACNFHTNMVENEEFLVIIKMSKA